MEDYLVLTNKEKAEIVKSQLKNLQQQKYYLDLSILQEAALGNDDIVVTMTEDAENLIVKENILKEELSKLV